MNSPSLLASRTRKRTLTEDQLVRILERGGMCLLSSGQWRVYRATDKRSACVGIALSHVVERLETQSRIRPVHRQPGRRVWCEKQIERFRPLPVPESLRPRRRRRAAKTAFEAALEFEKDDGARIRLIAASRRYLADWEQAATPQSVTMQWGQSRVDGGRDVSRYSGPGGLAKAAEARLAAVQSAVTDECTRMLDEMMLRDVSIAALERHIGLSAGQGAEAAHAALGKLAMAYDLNVRAV